MIKTKRIIQTDTWSCFACVAAMITNKTIQDIYSFVGHDGSNHDPNSTHPEKRRGFGTLEIIKYLAEHRYSIGTWSVFEEGGADISNYDEIQISVKINECPAVIEVPSDRLDNCTHVIYWDGNKLFDPSPGAKENPEWSDYNILKFMPVLHYEEQITND